MHKTVKRVVDDSAGLGLGRRSGVRDREAYEAMKSDEMAD
jgi:hypothetical protein